MDLWEYASPEYHMRPTPSRHEKSIAPFWKLPRERKDEIWQEFKDEWESRINHEETEPPLYYALAGAWWNIGRAFGLHGGFLLYWVRFLNVPMAAALVWLASIAARIVFPE